MSDSDKAASAGMGCIIILMVPVIYAWDGYILSILWEWHAVPMFGVKPISPAMAVGLIVTAWGLNGFRFAATSGTGDAQAQWIAYRLILPAIGLLVGYVAKGI